MEALRSRVEATIQKYNLLVPGERILVACSGGPDSVALFHVLRELSPRWNFRLNLIHFDHALRRESARDFRFVKKLARDFHVPFCGARHRARRSPEERGLSPEERAREIRYDFFRRMARKSRIRKIALGHHQDDQAETVLMRILQGTGLRGLQGIRPLVKEMGVTFIRPLLEVSRREILEFLRKRSFPYREDRTNTSQRFLRNRIRLRLLPFLEKEFNPQIRTAICRLAETATAESKSLDDWVKQHWKECIRSQRNGVFWLDRNRFLSLPSALQFRLLDQMLHRLHPRSGLDFNAWERIEKGLHRGRHRVTLPQNLNLTLTPEKLFITRNRR